MDISISKPLVYTEAYENAYNVKKINILFRDMLSKSSPLIESHFKNETEFFSFSSDKFETYLEGQESLKSIMDQIVRKYDDLKD